MTQEERELEQIRLELKALNQSERMAGVARRWEQSRPLGKFVFKNPYEQWKRP